MPLLSSAIRVPSYSSLAAISLSEIISALSFALDLTEGAIPGHALRTCLLGMRIAYAAQLPEDEIASLYYALLLKDSGCSSNAARMCQIVGGDDRIVKAGAKLEDWTKPHHPRVSTLRLLWQEVLPEANAVQRALRILKIGVTQHSNNEEMIAMRCDRGATIVRKLGLGLTAATAVRHLDEHWDGSGYPERWKRESIPMLSRIAAIAQHLDVFATSCGTHQAIKVLQERSGTWFDPELVRVAVSLHRDDLLWTRGVPAGSLEETRRFVIDLDPAHGQSLGAAQIDQICAAFADVVDAKSPFTFRHSLGVAEAASDIAKAMDLSLDRVQLIRRAALLHDIGKLRVPNSILDKPNGLNDEEREIVEEHPVLSRRILQRIASFQEIALVAGQHHEKLDGTGYPDHLTGKNLSLASRIVAVADVFGALREERPYRAALELDQIFAIMQPKAGLQLDGACIEALRAIH